MKQCYNKPLVEVVTLKTESFCDISILSGFGLETAVDQLDDSDE